MKHVGNLLSSIVIGFEHHWRMPFGGIVSYHLVGL
jgi:hypothetical protein